MTTKICFKCGIEKDIADFYKHSEMSDGHVNKCKECNKKDVSKNYEDNKSKEGFLEKERKRGREKHHRLYAKGFKPVELDENFYAKGFKYSDGSSYTDRYPEKYKARLLSQRVPKEFENAEKHHWSYNESDVKDVIQLTKKEHMKAHRFIIYDQERFMYRRYDTNELLDTKQKHEDFIKMCIETKPD